MKLNHYHIHARAAETPAADIDTASIGTAGLSVRGSATPAKSVIAGAICHHFYPHFILPLLSCAVPSLVFAAPEGGQVVAGSATISNPDANTTLITQTTAQTAIDWQRFNIGSQEYVQFAQPDASSVALNRVIGGNPSQILGNLSANGQVFLVNPNGVYFGQSATVDVGGLVASVRDISNENFMSGNYVFSKTPGAPDDVGIVNDGVITAKDSGYVVLMGDYVHNNGIISTRLGTVALAAGNSITMDVKGNGLVSVVIEEETLSDLAGVNNAGQIMADGGRVMMTAKVANDLIDTAINNEGLIVANSIAERNGVIFLTAAGGDIVNSGTLDASAEDGSGIDGGGVLVYSDKNIINVSGGKIIATGDGAGNGGVVRVIAEEYMGLESGALIDVTSENGKGGFVEVSGHKTLAIRGDIDLGSGGELVIDPGVLTINNGNNSPGFSTGGGTTSGFVGYVFIESQLNSNANVTLVANNAINAAAGNLNSTNATFTISATGGTGDLSIINGNVIVGGGSFNACGLTGVCLPTGTNSVVQGATGNINLATVSINIAGNLNVSAGSVTGNIGLGAVSAGSVDINGGGSISVAAVNAANQANLTGGVINAGSINASSSVSVNAGGLLAVTNVSAGNLASLSGGSINVGSITAGSSVLVNAVGSASVGTVGTVAAGRKISINVGASMTVGNLSANATAGDFAEIALTAGGNITQSSSATFNVSGGAAFVTASAGGNVSLNGTTLVTATAGTGVGIGGSNTQFGGVPVVGEAKVLIRNVGGSVTVNNVTANATVGIGDAELEIDAVQGSVLLLGTHTITAGNGQGADADLQVRNVVGNFTYSGTADISAGTQGTGVGGGLPAGRYQTQFEALRIGGSVFINGGGINVTGGANNAVAGGSSVEINLDSIGGQLDINAPLTVTSGINRDAELDIDDIGGQLNVSGTIVNGTATFSFAPATSGASCAGTSCGDVNITAPVNISVNTTAGAKSNTDAAIYIDGVFGNLTVANTAPLTLTAGTTAGADASFDIGGTGSPGVRGNVTLDGDMLFVANVGGARDASINFDFIGGNVSIGGNMTFNAGDDARIVLREIGGAVNITGNTVFTAGSGATASAIYDIKRVNGNVTLGGTKSFTAGNNATAGIQVSEIGGDLVINSGVTAQVGAATGAISQINTSRIAGNVILNGQTLLTSGVNGASLISVSSVGGVLTAPLNPYDSTGVAYVFTNGGCVSCGDVTLNGSVGSAGNVQDAVTSLSALNNVNINGDIYLGNADLTLAADSNSDGVGDVNITGAIGTTTTVSTQGNLNVSGNNFNVTGAGVTFGPVADSWVNVLANNINVTLSGGMKVIGGSYIPVSAVSTGAVLVDATVKANNNITINAASLTVSGGTANARPSFSTGTAASGILTVEANANLEAGADLTANLSGALNISGGVANADAGGSSGGSAPTFTATANANATLLAGGNLNITANVVNLSKGTENPVAPFGGVANASATSKIQGNNITLNVAASMNANSATVSAANNVVITAGNYTETVNNTLQAGNNVTVSAAGNYNVIGSYIAGNSISLSAGGTLDINRSFGSAGSVLNNNLSLAGGNIIIDENIYLGNNNLTLTGESASGTISIQNSPTTRQVNVSTQGLLSVTGNNLKVQNTLTGFQGTTFASVEVNAGTVNVVLTGNMDIQAGTFIPPSGMSNFTFVDASVTAASNISITAQNLSVSGGTVFADASGSAGTVNATANAGLVAGGDLTIDLTNDFNVNAGSASAAAFGFDGAIAEANATVMAGNNVSITATNVNLNAGTASTGGTGTGSIFAVANTGLSAGSALSVIASGDITGNSADISAAGMYMSAVNNIDLTTSKVSIGSGTVAGISGDAIALGVLADNGITLPTTVNPNAKFSAGGTLDLGTITMSGNVPYLWLEADTTNLQGLTLPDASDVVVQYSPFTVTKSIGVEDVPDTSQLVNYNNLEHFGILPGTTIIIGSSLQTGDINIGNLGDVNIGAKNIVFISSANINSIDNVISSGVVAELRVSQFNDQLIVDEDGNEYVAPVLTEVDVGLVPVDDSAKEKDKHRNLVKNDEEEKLMCEAG